MSEREPISDERTEAIQSRNIRWIFGLLNYALAGDVFYRGAIARQDFSAFADIFYIWVAASLGYVILDLATGGTTLVAFKVSAFPVFVVGVAVAGFVAVLVGQVDVWLITAGGFALVLLAIVARAVLARRRRRG